MIVKALEIRDRATMIPVIAIKLEAADKKELDLLAYSGFGREPENYVVVYKLQDSKGEYDPFNWPSGSRTMNVAHRYIHTKFNDLQSGDVVCVEHILGERDTPKTSDL